MKKIIVTALALFALAGCTSTTDELPSTSAEPDVPPAAAADSEDTASTSEAIITDCRPRSSRSDGCRFAASWGHLTAIFAGSWGHPFRSIMGPPAREA